MGRYPTHGAGGLFTLSEILGMLVIASAIVSLTIVALFGKGANNEVVLGASGGVLFYLIAWALNYAVYKFKKWKDDA